MRISAHQAIDLMKKDPEREDILWLPPGEPEEPVVSYVRQKTGKYTMSLMASNELLEINETPTELALIRFAVLPPGITWWDIGYEQHIDTMVEG